MRILLSRTDNIGDLLFSLPLASMLKSCIPSCYIIFLVKASNVPLAQRYVDVDEVLSFNPGSSQQLLADLLSLNLDVCIHVMPNDTIEKAAKAANIELRIGRFTSWKSIYYNNCPLFFNKSTSGKHELELNSMLLKPLCRKDRYNLARLTNYLSERLLPLQQSQVYIKNNGKFNLILHPGSNGNGEEWPLESYVALANILPQQRCNIFLTGSSSELVSHGKYILARAHHVHNCMGKFNLTEFMDFIKLADGIVASGTGPIHMAAAFGCYSVGLFPESAHSGVARWSPLGPRVKTFTAVKVANISATKVAKVLLSYMD